MASKDFDPSMFPKEIQDALAREPVVLGPASIGKHFRNQEEVADASQVFEQTARVSIPLGLAGSRLDGKFTYGAERLAARLLGTYGNDALIDDSLGENPFLFFEQQVAQAATRLNLVVDFLEQHVGAPNFDDIHLTDLPPDFQKLVKINPDRIARSLLPRATRGRKSDIEDFTPSQPVLPRPAALYPDIDMAVILPPQPRDELELLWTGALTHIGRQSGTRFHVTAIPPEEVSPTHRNHNPIYLTIMSQFRLLVQEISEPTNPRED